MIIKLNAGQYFLRFSDGKIVVTASEERATEFETMEYATKKLSELREFADFDEAVIVEDFL